MNGNVITNRDGTILTSLEYCNSALILFQFSFELLFKSLIKLKGGSPVQTHDLLKLLADASRYFPGLLAIPDEDKKFLAELSSEVLTKKGKTTTTLMYFKYGTCGIQFPEGKDLLSDTLRNIYQLLDKEIRAFMVRVADS